MKHAVPFVLLAAAAAGAAIAAPRPVLVDTDSDCFVTGEVTGLGPRDNFLSVRAGPGVRERELDRLRNGHVVQICDNVGHGAWWGIVYSRTPGQDCRIVARPGRPRPYRGPCRSGWVSGRYIQVNAG